jgi:hypothetical protein
MWADWVSAKSECGPGISGRLCRRTSTTMRGPDPKHYLIRFKPPAYGHLGISGSRCSMDIVSNEYSSATLCLQSGDGPYFTPSTESCRLTSGENSPWEHWLERAIVELNDEGEHQVEQVAVLSREVEAKNVTDGSDGFGLFTPPG